MRKPRMISPLVPWVNPRDEERIGGPVALKELQTYVKKLGKKYGSRAFQHFREACMTILLNN